MGENEAAVRPQGVKPSGESKEGKGPSMGQTSLVDAHCHLDEIPDYAPETGVRPITCGHSHPANVKTLAIARRFKLPFALGISPQEAQRGDIRELETWIGLIRQSKPNAIGEIGLDFHWAKTQEQKDRQYHVFDRMLGLAQEMQLPIVLHCREAGDAMLDVLGAAGWRHGAMWHFFSGNETQMQRALDMGMMLSIPPLPSNARESAIRKTPLTQLLVETDAPIGSRTPAGVQQAVEYVARVKGTTVEEIAKQTAKNAARLFRFEI